MKCEQKVRLHEEQRIWYIYLGVYTRTQVRVLQADMRITLNRWIFIHSFQMEATECGLRGWASGIKTQVFQGKFPVGIDPTQNASGFGVFYANTLRWYTLSPDLECVNTVGTHRPRSATTNWEILEDQKSDWSLRSFRYIWSSEGLWKKFMTKPEKNSKVSSAKCRHLHVRIDKNTSKINGTSTPGTIIIVSWESKPLNSKRHHS